MILYFKIIKDIFNIFQVSFSDFNKYLINLYPEMDFYRDLIPKMKNICLLILKSVFMKLDP